MTKQKHKVDPSREIEITSKKVVMIKDCYGSSSGRAIYIRKGTKIKILK